MPIQEGKYVTPAWQNGGPPALDAAELTDIGNSIVTNQTNIENNTADIETANENIQQNSQDIDSINESIQNIQNSYLLKSGGTMTGAINMGNNKITNLAVPSNPNDAVTVSYLGTKLYKQIFSTSLTFSNFNTQQFSATIPSSWSLESAKSIILNVMAYNVSSLTTSLEALFIGASYSNVEGYGWMFNISNGTISEIVVPLRYIKDRGVEYLSCASNNAGNRSGVVVNICTISGTTLTGHIGFYRYSSAAISLTANIKLYALF